MDRERQLELIELAQFAFEQAEEQGYISVYSSESEIEQNASRIMEFADIELDELNDEERDLCCQVLRAGTC